MPEEKQQTIQWPKGSQWRKWDLHIHSPASYLNHQFGNDWDVYVQRLFRTALDKDLAVIGITDYFTIDGYKKIKHEYLGDEKKLRSLFSADEVLTIKKILLLPNVEFRLNKLVGQSRINCHVIFSEEVQPRDIEEHFLHDLNFTYQAEPQQTAQKRKLKLDNLRALGERLLEHQSFATGNPLIVGMMNAVVDDDEIAARLADDRFRGKYMLGVVADEDLSRISWESQDHHTRKVLIQRSDVLFSANPRTRLWALGQEPYQNGIVGFLHEFRTLKPCIHGSDAHGFADIGHPCSKRGARDHSCTDDPDACDLRHCWLKADPTFEGLKQTLYEPEARIAIQSVDPTPVKSTYSLDTFRIEAVSVSTELSIKAAELSFNADLIAVIGGKGRGKTALVDLLANSFQDRARSRHKNSFVQRIADQAPSLATELRFRNGEAFGKRLTNRTFFEGADIA